MNEKIQAILLKVVIELKKLQWSAAPDWEVTLKGEGHVPMIKNVSVEGSIGDEEFQDTVETAMDLKLVSDDQITYFPDYTVFGQILIPGGPNEDIAYKMDADVAFTDADISNERKIKEAAIKINRLVDSHIQTEFTDYVGDNHQDIEYYKKEGWKADDDARDDR